LESHKGGGVTDKTKWDTFGATFLIINEITLHNNIETTEPEKTIIIETEKYY